jgi:hypothetical protein
VGAPGGSSNLDDQGAVRWAIQCQCDDVVAEDCAPFGQSPSGGHECVDLLVVAVVDHLKNQLDTPGPGKQALLVDDQDAACG